MGEGLRRRPAGHHGAQRDRCLGRRLRRVASELPRLGPSAVVAGFRVRKARRGHRRAGPRVAAARAHRAADASGPLPAEGAAHRHQLLRLARATPRLRERRMELAPFVPADIAVQRGSGEDLGRPARRRGLRRQQQHGRRREAHAGEHPRRPAVVVGRGAARGQPRLRLLRLRRPAPRRPRRRRARVFPRAVRLRGGPSRSVPPRLGGPCESPARARRLDRRISSCAVVGAQPACRTLARWHGVDIGVGLLVPCVARCEPVAQLACVLPKGQAGARRLRQVPRLCQPPAVPRVARIADLACVAAGAGRGDLPRVRGALLFGLPVARVECRVAPGRHRAGQLHVGVRQGARRLGLRGLRRAAPQAADEDCGGPPAALQRRRADACADVVADRFARRPSLRPFGGRRHPGRGGDGVSAAPRGVVF
mmetsp:Transcript_116781/g.335170  ORF Transcript_116781/g.335170 Transcript_116781/m.335170 type:complete len:423 (-) Transcript_116781:92-1360(-)